MENPSRLARPGRLLLVGAALCAAQSSAAAERHRTINVGAIVIASSQCRVNAASGSRCSGSAPAPAVSAASPAAASPATFAGQLEMKMSARAAALDSRQTATSTLEPVVLTIAP
jgi:hypothetical protein